METLTGWREPSDSTACGGLRWVMLNRRIIDDEDSRSSSASAHDANTTVVARTSSGRVLSVSLCLAPPPRSSSFYAVWLGGDGPAGSNSKEEEDNDDDTRLLVLAAHDDCVLIEVSEMCGRFGDAHDYFLYEAGAARPPSLSLLPGRYFPMQCEQHERAGKEAHPRSLSFPYRTTGVLRLGDGDVLVAQLEFYYDKAELCVFRFRPGSGSGWVLSRVPVVHREEEGGEEYAKLQGRWRPEFEATVPVGNRFMCWVDSSDGFYLCDMAAAEENRKLRYVPAPVATASHRGNGRPESHRSLAAAGTDAVRFVSVAPRCCCGGGVGESSCERSRFAFNVTTWTMNNLRTTTEADEPMKWFKDGVLDCDEIWQLPSYGRLPRVAPRCPVVSADDPDIVCFMVCEAYKCIAGADETVWMVETNTSSKTIISVVRTDIFRHTADACLPIKLHIG
ncbi:hypothetical protein BS78_05G090200 [Paspalum vaginatum]|nr:hypothetical protein BS78_05G090200 [Paspalum vaginatum]